MHNIDAIIPHSSILRAVPVAFIYKTLIIGVELVCGILPLGTFLLHIHIDYTDTKNYPKMFFRVVTVI